MRLHTPKFSGSSARENFFSNRLLSTWNKLPDNIINSPNLFIFKSRLQHFDLTSIYTTRLDTKKSNALHLPFSYRFDFIFCVHVILLEMSFVYIFYVTAPLPSVKWVFFYIFRVSVRASSFFSVHTSFSLRNGKIDGKGMAGCNLQGKEILWVIFSSLYWKTVFFFSIAGRTF